MKIKAIYMCYIVTFVLALRLGNMYGLSFDWKEKTNSLKN